MTRTHILILLLLTVCLLTACHKYPVLPIETLSATETPTVTPTVPPATVPTVLPSTVPTAPPTETAVWQTEPEYLSYEDYFSEDRPYNLVNNQKESWLIPEGDSFIKCSLNKSRHLYIRVSTEQETYAIPNSQSLCEHEILMADGKHAYLGNSTGILQIDLLTGNITGRIPAESIVNDTIYTFDGLVAYYADYTGGKLQLCRVYLPEMRQDVLYTLDVPVYLFSGGYAESTLGKLSWMALNPDMQTVLTKELANPESPYRTPSLDLASLWEAEAPLGTKVYESTLMHLCEEIQNTTGIRAWTSYSYNTADGTLTEKTAVIDACFYGYPDYHDHFHPVEVTLGEPIILSDAWKPLPNSDTVTPLPTGGRPDGTYKIEYSSFGTTPPKLYINIDGVYSVLLDIELKGAPYFVDPRNGIFCITADNRILQLSYDGTICNTIYASNWTLRDFINRDTVLYVIEKDTVLEIDTVNLQYRKLLRWARMKNIGLGHYGIAINANEGISSSSYFYHLNSGELERRWGDSYLDR